MSITGPFAQTVGGRYLSLLTPDHAVIRLEEIAHALSNICRFTGHVRTFYSVAQHSVLCSQHAAPEHRWAALMHDAAEAYIGDVSRPLKQLLPDYRVIEKRLEGVIEARFQFVVGPEVKRVDREALATERRDLMPDTGEAWPVTVGVTPWPETIEPWSPLLARALFIEQVSLCGMAEYFMGGPPRSRIETAIDPVESFGISISRLPELDEQPDDSLAWVACPGDQLLASVTALERWTDDRPPSREAIECWREALAKPGAAVETQLSYLRARMSAFYTRAEIDRWWREPHPQLGGRRAIDALAAGRFLEVRQIIDRLDGDAFL